MQQVDAGNGISGDCGVFGLSNKWYILITGLNLIFNLKHYVKSKFLINSVYYFNQTKKQSNEVIELVVLHAAKAELGPQPTPK